MYYNLSISLSHSLTVERTNAYIIGDINIYNPFFLRILLCFFLRIEFDAFVMPVDSIWMFVHLTVYIKLHCTLLSFGFIIIFYYCLVDFLEKGINKC